MIVKVNQAIEENLRSIEIILTLLRGKEFLAP